MSQATCTCTAKLGESALRHVTERFLARNPEDAPAMRGYFEGKWNLFLLLTQFVTKRVHAVEKSLPDFQNSDAYAVLAHEAVAQLRNALIQADPDEAGSYGQWFDRNEAFLHGLGTGVGVEVAKQLGRHEQPNMLALSAPALVPNERSEAAASKQPVPEPEVGADPIEPTSIAEADDELEPDEERADSASNDAANPVDADAEPENAPSPVLDLPPDEWTPRARTEANVAAINILASGVEIGPPERLALARYSGWGTLSIDAVRERIPPGWLPERRGQIHEYYTPSKVTKAVAEIVRPLLTELEDEEGHVHALEPAAGIGRFIHALSGPGFEAVCFLVVEYSRISAKLLQALRPDLAVFQGPFEQWVTEHAAEWTGRLGLVVSNPPYGVRGASLTLDKDRDYRERRRAYAYFLRRVLDLLQPGGLGIFLIPYGFLSGQGAEHRALREKVLRRHHLACAFRLPSDVFPGALLVTDLLFFRCRGGELPAVLPQDSFILEGRYFAEFPRHILGQEVGEKAADPSEQGIDASPQRAKKRWGYQVEGTFDPYLLISQYQERPQCRDCTLQPVARKPLPRKVAAEEISEDVQGALLLAQRVSTYLTAIAKADQDSLQKAHAWHTELRPALLAWSAQPAELRAQIYAAQKRHPDLQPLLAAFTEEGKLIAQFDAVPPYVPRYAGTLEDVVAQATFLYQQRKELTLEELAAWHQRQGGNAALEQIRTALLAADWAFEYPAVGTAALMRILPAQDYYAGELWPRYDAAQAQANLGDEVAVQQARRLLAAIAPVTFAEIDQIAPRLGWIPIEILSAFTHAFTGQTIELERKDGLVTLADTTYTDIYPYVNHDQRILLGYLNHDLQLFKPDKDKLQDENQDAARLRYHDEIRTAFRDFLAAQPQMQAAITHAYNRTYRGFIQATYSQAEIPIARWSPTGPVLKGYQWAGVRRLVTNRGGLLAFDPGLGKTLTDLAALAVARQQGWARRAVIICPNSVLFNWHREIRRALPDYRIGVIGAERYIAKQGPRKGEPISGPDTKEARAYKWSQFKAGMYDVVLLARSMLDRTQIRPETLQPLLREDPGIMRMLGLQVRNDLKPRKKKGARTASNQTAAVSSTESALTEMAEREQAIFEEKEQRFIAERLEMEERGEPDPGIFWEDLGIDWLCVDEVHEGFKNLWVASPREGGMPKFLGSPQTPAKSAWQLYFRAAIVENHTGGGGIIITSATPAKNSPLEFYTVLMYVDRRIWRRLGITDPEQYIDRYLKIEQRLIASTSLETEEVPCVTGFQNLDELRPTIHRTGEFRTAKEVGLKLPEPRVRRIELPMNEAQEEKYARYREEFAALMAQRGKTTGDRHKMLGLLQRMSLVAIHPELDRGDWSWSNADQVTNPHCPKFDAAADIILSKRDCGHIIFMEPIAAHAWQRQVLIEAGIPAERIAVLNASAVPGTAERQRIAERFSGDPERGIAPDLDVVISNAVGNTGMNLQGRTCTILQADTPWEPATITQRNGRAVRQGNTQEVVEIVYLLSARSMDFPRLQILTGKLGWMSALIESMDNETSNPAAQSGLSPEELILYLARDKDDALAKLEQVKARRQEESRQKLRLEAWRMLRGLSARAQDRRKEKDPILLAQLDESMGKLRRNLESLDPNIWPYRFLIPVAQEGRGMLFFADAEGALWEGGRCVEYNADGQPIGGFELGRLAQRDQETGIAYRSLGKVTWEFFSMDTAKLAWRDAYARPALWQRPWPEADDNIQNAMTDALDDIRRNGRRALEALHWGWALPDFKSRIWDAYGPALVEAVGDSSEDINLPADLGGRLEFLSGARLRSQISAVLPLTEAGYARFLKLAPASRLKWSELDGVARFWWERGIPRDLMARREIPEPVTGQKPEATPQAA